MLAIPPQGISDALVALFAESRELRADELHRKIRERYFHCSPRAVYKELNNLIGRGVVVKLKDQYSLSITWILNLIRFSETLYSTSVESKPRISRMPEEGERLRWSFHDLQHLDRLWIQLMFLMFEHSTSRTMFAWVPCFWFDLVHYQKDLEAQRAMKIAGNKMYMMIGSRTFLDKLPTKYWSKDVYEWSYAESPFEHQRTTHFDVVDDFILTVTIDQETTNRIEALFSKIRSKNDLGLAREFEVIKDQARAKMVLERSAQKAVKLRKKSCEFFGIRDPYRNQWPAKVD